jgi:hypothetical protein
MDEKHFRKIYISILERAEHEQTLDLPYWKGDKKVFWAAKELKEDGYLEGGDFRDYFQVRGITLKGRMLLLQLKRDEREESWIGWLWAKGSVIFGFILGASADLFKDVWVHAAHHFFPGIFPAQ